MGESPGVDRLVIRKITPVALKHVVSSVTNRPARQSKHRVPIKSSDNGAGPTEAGGSNHNWSKEIEK